MSAERLMNMNELRLLNLIDEAKWAFKGHAYDRAAHHIEEALALIAAEKKEAAS